MTFNPVSAGYQSGRNDRYWSELTYVMRPKEDLNDVAQRYGVSVNELLAANPQVASATSVKAGEEITIPVSAENGVTQNGVPLADIESANPQILDSNVSNVSFTADAPAIRVQQQNPAGTEVDKILDAVTAAGDTRAQLEALSQRYPAASSDAIRSQLLSDPRATKLFDEAARYANEPLAGASADPRNPDVLPQTNEAITRLDEITDGLDPEVAADVVERALPEYESISQNLDGMPVLGFDGTQTAVRIADRVWGASNGSSLVDRIVELDTTDVTGVATPVSEGAGPAYLIELGRQGGSLQGNISMFESSLSGVEQFRNGAIADHAENYSEHLDELSFLVENGGAAMSSQQLDAAIQAYSKEKGPEWEGRLNELRAQLSSDGTALLNQVQQLEAGLPTLPKGERDGMRKRIADLLSSSEAQLAVSMALNENPQLVKGTAGNDLVQTFADLKIVGKDNGLAVVLVSAYLRENVMGPAANIDLSNPASVATMRTQLEDALRNNAGLASVLQVTPDQLSDVADGLLGLMPEQGRVDEFEFANNVGRNTNNALDKLDATLGRSNPFNLAFRTSAVAIVGSGLVDAIDRYGDDPRLRNGVDVVLESARVGVDSTQLFATLRQWPEGTGVSTLKTAGKFVHVLGATMAGADGLKRLGQGDYVGAGLSFAAAGGVAWGALGSSAVAGPLGFGAATVATLGLWIHDGIRQSNHANRFQTDTTARFLQHADFDKDAAHVLNDHSGEGYSVVPLLMRYGELRGLTEAQTVDWVNSIDTDRLAILRDNMHRTLDEIDGDVSRFQRTHDSDRLVVSETEQRPWFAATGVSRPMSAAQLEAVLTVLQVRRP